MITLATVAPAVFVTVGQEAGGRVMVRLFPIYYASSLGFPAAAMIFILIDLRVNLRNELRRHVRRGRAAAFTLGTLALALVVAALNWFVLQPRIGDVRRAMHGAPGPADQVLVDSFGRLHALSMGALALLMFLAVAAIVIEILAAPRLTESREK
jgi:hypothetical protein